MSIIDKSGVNKIWIYNTGIEHIWENKRNGIRKVKNSNEQKILNRQAELLYFIAKKNDTVFVVKESEPEFLEDMKIFGVEKPRTILLDDADMPISRLLQREICIMEHLKSNEDGKRPLYVPYVLSDEDVKISGSYGFPIYGSTPDIVKNLNNKAKARRIVNEMGLNYIEGFICTNKQEFQENHKKLIASGFTKFAVKEPHNSAGKGVFFIKDDKQFQSFCKMMRFDEDNKSFEVLLEGWIDNKRDINYQIEVSETGGVEFLGITEQIISVTSYKGAIYPPKLTAAQESYYMDCAYKIGNKLYSMGFTGVVGIDSIIAEDGKIYPAIEFNVRFNQSTFYIPFFQYFKNDRKRILIRSYDVKTDFRLDYSRLKRALIYKNVFYNAENKKGIVILNSACLSSYMNENRLYDSRIYFGDVYDNTDSDDNHFNQLDDLIKQLKDENYKIGGI